MKLSEFNGKKVHIPKGSEMIVRIDEDGELFPILEARSGLVDLYREYRFQIDPNVEIYVPDEWQIVRSGGRVEIKRHPLAADSGANADYRPSGVVDTDARVASLIEAVRASDRRVRRLEGAARQTAILAQQARAHSERQARVKEAQEAQRAQDAAHAESAAASLEENADAHLGEQSDGQ